MFGMGFTEIMFIAVIAILFLGPDKLPEAMVQIAKLFKSVRNTLNEAKSTFEEEVRIKELREEALNYRKQIEEASSDIAGFKNAIPNPAEELQDAISSIGGAPGIGGDRYLDDDILAEIEKAEQQATAKASDPIADLTPEDAPEKKAKKKKKKKSKKKATKEAVDFKHFDGEEHA